MELKALLKQLPQDLRAETIAHELAAQHGLDTEKIVMIPLGHFKRSYQKDVADIQLEEKHGRVHKVIMQLNRDGLYDSLPEGLFHQPTHPGANPFKSAEEMVRETKRIRREEEEARKFFAVFETAINQLRISLEGMEHGLIPGVATGDFQHELFEKLWGVHPELTDQQKIKLFYLLPIANRISGNAEELTLCFRILLNEEVKVNYVGPSLQQSEIELSGLGEMHLAIDAIVGHQFNDGIMDIKVSIGPLGKENLLSYLPSGDKFRVLKTFYNYFIPAECNIVTEVLIKEDIKALKLEAEAHIGRLGHSTYLGIEL